MYLKIDYFRFLQHSFYFYHSQKSPLNNPTFIQSVSKRHQCAYMNTLRKSKDATFETMQETMLHFMLNRFHLGLFGYKRYGDGRCRYNIFFSAIQFDTSVIIMTVH